MSRVNKEVVNNHAYDLGFRTWDDYFSWCSHNGFHASANKSPIELREEVRHRKIYQAVKNLKKHKKYKIKNFLQELVVGEISENLPYYLKQAYEKVWPEYRRVYANLLLHLYKNSKMLKNQDYYEPLSKVMMYHKEWKRNFDDWKPHSYNPKKQFSELVRHLLCKYEVPRFMDTAWYTPKVHGFEGMSNFGPMDWFVEMGNGTNIRKCPGIPVPLTKKMAHHFTQAPHDFNIKEAFIWAQVLSEGGDERLVNNLLSTQIGRSFNHNDFRLQVIRFFIANPMLDPVQIGPIIDYIWNQKFTNRRNYRGSGEVEILDPPQPNFSMTGRTVDALIAQVERWHRQLGKERKDGKIEWEHSLVGDFRHTEGKGKPNQRTWVIRELLSSKELASEGRAMKHCVASFSHSCSRGSCSIFTMEKETFGFVEKLLTIEVAQNAIRQVRGKLNRLPSPNEARIIKIWVGKEGLSIRRYLNL